MTWVEGTPAPLGLLWIGVPPRASALVGCDIWGFKASIFHFTSGLGLLRTLLEQRIAATIGIKVRIGGCDVERLWNDKDGLNIVLRFSQMLERCQGMIMNCKRVANHVGYRFGNEQMMKVVSSGWSFVSTILGQMTYSIASPTLDSAGSYVMQGAPFTQGTIPSISIGGIISPEGFLLLVLLLVVIIVIVVVVIVILIVVVVVDDVSLILKLSFEIIDFLHKIMLYYLIH
ncbi:hypothetical protein Tco_1113703 [Tanacetum coccineum]|uniref:Uncharacterized protein n=1 Tax=Tanacetum coccineum TaxID=301880 RepID=A0ABQ5IUE9_9ASTR